MQHSNLPHQFVGVLVEIKMTLEWYLCGVILLWLCTIDFADSSLVEPEIIVELNSVTSFEGLEQFYKELRNETNGVRRRKTTGVGASPDNPTPELDTSAKTQLCQNIFPGSFYFEGKTLVNPEEVRQDLRDNHRRIFWAIFNTKEEVGWRETRYRYVYANDSKPYKVKVADGAEYDEHVFTCLLREERDGPLKQYLVSDYEYDVTESGEFHAIGRFVFVPEANRLVIRALAEQPAIAHKSENANRTELSYLLKRAIYSPARNAENDPICKLTEIKKLRLCTAVLTGLRDEWLEDKVKFTPDSSNVEHVCRKKIVSVSNACLDPDTDRYKEWMIGCKATTKGEEEPTTYFVSRGYNDNEVLVYQAAEGERVTVHHHSRRAAVITVVAEPDHHLCPVCRLAESEPPSPQAGILNIFLG